MEATIRVLGEDGDSSAEVRRLLAWLRDEPDLRGSGLRLDGVVREEEMGLDAEMIMAVLGPAGAGAALLSAISAFLTARGPRNNVRIRVEGPDGSVELDARMKTDDIDDFLRRTGAMTGLAQAPDATA
ncbi:hypothetical protein AB0M02_12165 [Actinoplanes sp. NPDC051861]|uniref:effector-associated constant component EACC1 n=1 Tax=Actinoplanes sp. NPDC051861 TaxID=3155170 RepID=UPI00341B4432